MAVSPKNIDIELVKRLSPLDTLPYDKVAQVLDKSVVQNIPKGKALFQEGERDQWTVYLLSGEATLSSSTASTKIIKAGETNALSPLSDGVPRLFTATTSEQSSVLIIDTELLKVIVNGASPGSIEVSDLSEDEDDWMSKFLQSDAFIQLPTANMQSVMMKLQEVPLSKGKMVIQEGDTQDQNYYIIKQGQCIVSRKDIKTGKQKPLAIINSGTGFGEEALITGVARGATVSMKDDGVVLKLFKDDFIELLVKPIIQINSSKQIEAIKESGFDVTFVDVREKLDFLANGLENSIHCPIQSVRNIIPTLDENMHYILYSNTEHRASAAAFLFIQQNLDASVLRDGVGEPTTEELESAAKKSGEYYKKKSEFVVKEVGQSESSDKDESSADTDDAGNKDIAHYKQQLDASQEARKKAELIILKLKKELIKTREIAQKEAKLAKNAVKLLKQAEEKIKNLEA